MGATFALHSVLLKKQELLKSNYTNNEKHARFRVSTKEQRAIRSASEVYAISLAAMKIRAAQIEATGWAGHFAAMAS
jgi:hypothetical protein